MGTRATEQSYYEILEISPQASQSEIYEAYQRAKMTYSPDSPALYTMFSKEEARELLNLIEEAFVILGNQAKRCQYDQRIGNVAATLSAKDLPDFTDQAAPTPTAAPIPKPAPKSKKTVARGSTPEGYGKTRISVFPINEEMEQQISGQVDFTGPFLQKIRMYKQITIEQLSRETRVSKSYLAALENEDYHGLPAQVFVRGYVVQVARTLELDDLKVSASYMDRFKKACLD